MKIKLFNFLGVIALLCSWSVYSQTVTNQSTLNNAISAAGPGTTIILANSGIWNDVTISINKNGNATNPIIIKAETPGAVIFSGKTNVKLGGSYIYFEGVVFQNPPAMVTTGTPLIEFRASNTDCNNCKVTNIKIDSFNQSSSQQTEVFKWILLRGHHNEISYCSFLGKHGVGSIINDNRETNIENFHKIHHNYFANRKPQSTSVVNADNDQDAIRLGNSSTSLSDSSSEVYENYFYNFVGEIEVISNKSGNNKYYNNTFENYSGALTLRHGNNCEVYNNFFLANGYAFSGGVRVMGENHKIYNNYIEGVRSRYPNGNLSSGVGGINIANGRNDGVLNGYFPVKNTIIINNTFVNCDYGIRIGTKFSSTQSVAPDNVVVGNNILFVNTTMPNTNSNRAIQVTTNLTGASSKYENNISQTGVFDAFGTIVATGNINVASGLLASDGDLYRVKSGSAAIDYGLGSYGFLINDVFGAARPVMFDAGAEEFGASGTRLPYKQADLGVSVGFGGSEALNITENTIRENNLHIYPVPIKGSYLNVSLEKQHLGQVQIIDMLGRTVVKSYFNTSKGQVDIDNLTHGSYIIKVQGISKMIVVQ
ncbi:chondroitinase-B domain-containing protein [Mariniflexile ostreae]|uniref:Chondroitinase-B domain-containing protein n=1 Tax=Mariniflexile ostreae TaxID=1520892 RepID=A0ABV5FDF4_9FLAO